MAVPFVASVGFEGEVGGIGGMSLRLWITLDSLCFTILIRLM